MANTETTLINQVLGNLGVIGAGETPSAEDSATVQERIRPVIAQYIALGIDMSADTTDLTDIPDAIFLPLADLIAYECATPFQIGGVKRQELMLLQQQADINLRRIYRQAFNPRRLRVPRIGRHWPGHFNWTTGQ